MRWIVLSGGFTGDGSSTHSLFRTSTDARIPIFDTRERAEAFAMSRVGEYSLIAEVVAEGHPTVVLQRLTIETIEDGATCENRVKNQCSTA